MLYICDKTDFKIPLIHITFLLEQIEEITLPTNEFDDNPIHLLINMIQIDNLTDWGFTEKFKNIVKQRFPKSGSYMGLKSSIGL